jgi:hypothetical protein
MEMKMAGAGTLSLQRLVLLHRHRRFGKMLYPLDPAIARGVLLLRVHEAWLRRGERQSEAFEQRTLLVGQKFRSRHSSDGVLPACPDRAILIGPH